jgi:L-ascorbate metabolism protein UlaG (beta-lactamase superfamily)
MKITYLSHSGLLIETGAHRIAIDPYLTDSPLAPMRADDLQCDFILITHGHDDHVGDAPEIAKRCDATIIANYEIVSYFGAQGLRTHGMYHGGKWDFPFGRVKMVPAIHGSGFPKADGSILQFGTAAGFVLTLEGRHIYHAGDTCLFSDMTLISRRTPLDVSFLPIGDNFTMGIEEAVEAVKLLQPHRVVPVHFNTWPEIRVDPQEFAARVRAETSTQPMVLAPGEILTL